MHNPKLSKMLTRTSINLCFMVTLTLAAWLGLVSPALAQGPIIRVTPGGDPAADGSDWSNATVLTNALSIALPGAEIWVASGVYTPGTTVNDTFSLPAGVALYGGFVATETQRSQRDWAANLTILSGDIGGNDTTDATGVVTTTTAIVGDNAYHVLYLDGTTNPITASTIIDGFTITAGQATDWSGFNCYGGGLFCNGEGGECSPSLVNVIFTGNWAGVGGAMANNGWDGVSSPSLVNVTFSGNSADSLGGAVYNNSASPSLTDVSFTGNSAGDGGAMANNGWDGVSSPSLVNVTFSGNSADGDGGAMYNDGSHSGVSNPSLTDVTFTGNSADGPGGAMYNNGSLSGVSNPSLTDVTFTGNSAGTNGGAMYNDGTYGVSSPSLTNAIFSGNSAYGLYYPSEYGGGAMYNYGYRGESSPSLTNVTFTGNLASSRGGAMFNFGNNGESSPRLTNVTFSGNSAGDSGGAMYNYGYGNDDWYDGGVSSPILTDVTFTGNSAIQGSGGAMVNSGTTGIFGSDGGVSSPSLTNVTFSDNSADDSGGAMYTESDYGGECSLSLDNVSFSGNTAIQGSGGAMYNQDYGILRPPSLTDVTFSDNSAGADGGAMYYDDRIRGPNPILTKVTFTGNTTAVYGGAMWGAGNLTDVTFTGNSAIQGSGGAMFGWGSSLTNVTFFANSAENAGGAMQGGGSLTNVTFSGNSAGVSGGALDGGGSLTDVTFSGNSAGGIGGALNGSGSLTNVTFSGNSAGQYGGAMATQDGTNMTNVIMWGNTATISGTQLFNMVSTVLSYTLIQSGTNAIVNWGSSNISYGPNILRVDPLFVDAAGADGLIGTPDDDLRLQDNSPAIDAGLNSAIGLATDLAGQPRKFDNPLVADTGLGTPPIVDMGAYENQGGCPVANPIYVDKDATTGANSGDSWLNAFTDLQDGLSVARLCTGLNEIWVASGVYTPGLNQSDAFNPPAGVALYGGFAGDETQRSQRDWAAHPTILSGDIGGDDTTDATGVVTTTAAITGTNARHVLSLDGTTSPITESTIIDGFTITAGDADLRGGGLFCDGRGSGGQCSPSLANVIFSGNRANPRGGAMFNYGYNGGESSPGLTNVTFTGNSAQEGGAMYNNGSSGVSSPRLTNVIFSGNRAGFGGAMVNFGDSGESSPRLTNVTLSGNSANNKGGAMFNLGTSGESSPHLTNVILWGNTATISGTQLYNYAATPVLSYTLIQSGTNDIVNDPIEGGSVSYGDGILIDNPLFAAAAGGDLRLLSGSPAIDSGTATGAPAFDIRGLPRPVNGKFDMGAYEMQTSGSGSDVYLPLIMK